MAKENPSEARQDNFPRNFCLIFTVIFFLLYWPRLLALPSNGIFSHMEDVWTDLLFQFRGPRLPTGDPRIIIAALDEDAGQKYGFPVPRLIQAQLLDKLKGLGVKTAAFDVMFFDPREGDGELAAATRRFGRVIHLFVMHDDIETGAVGVVNEPVPALKKAAQHLGYPNVQGVTDPDGHLRRALLFDKRFADPQDPSLMAPSLDAAIVASYQDRSLSEIQTVWANPVPRLLLLNVRRPVTWQRHELSDPQRDAHLLAQTTVDSPYRRLSVVDILEGRLTQAQKRALKGAIVIVGSTTLGYYDHYPNPFDPTSPGVDYHANIIDNVLHEDFLRVVLPIAILVVILFMIWLPFFFRRFSAALNSVAVVAVLLSWGAFVYWNFCRGVRTDFVAPVAALLLSSMVLTARRALTEGAEKRFIKQTFGQFVSPEVVEKLVADPSLLKLGGDKREMTVFFLDIANFTSISEKMPPEALIQFLNKYLTALSRVIQDRKGTVDKYIGDCIMAFWNAPLDDPDHRLNACLAAVECQALMSELNRHLQEGAASGPAIRIGLNAGAMTVGLTGSEKKLAYTVIGDEVNLGARLEGANKFFGSRIMASESVFEGAKHAVEGRLLGRVLVIGKAIPIRVFELLGKKGEMGPAWEKALSLYHEGLTQHEQRRYADAVRLFEEVLRIFPEDGPSRFYLKAARAYSDAPPAESWDGVIRLAAK